MTKLALLMVLTTFGVAGTLLWTPFIGVALYYFYAVLRPQWLWQWDLPVEVPWSFYVAVTAMFGTFIWKMGDWIASTQRRGVASPPHVLAHWVFFAFAGMIITTYYTAEHRNVAYEAFNEYIKIFVMYAVASIVVVSLRQVWVLYLLLALTLCYIAVDVNQIYFVQGYLFVYRMGFGGLDNNGAALMLAMSVPLCLFAWDGLRHWCRWGFLLMIPITVHAVLTSYSRGAMVALLVCIPVYFFRCTRKRQLTVLMCCMAALVPFLAGKEIQDRFFSVEKFQEDDSANSRLVSWGIAWRMANERPFFGFGIRNSNLYTFSYGADMDGRTIHSQYLQIAADSGLVALTLYLAAIGTFLLALHKSRLVGRSWLNTEKDHDGRRVITMANGLESCMIVFMVGAVFLSLENFEIPYIVLLLGAQLWAIVAAQDYERKVDPVLELYQQLWKQMPRDIIRTRWEDKDLATSSSPLETTLTPSGGPTFKTLPPLKTPSATLAAPAPQPNPGDSPR